MAQKVQITYEDDISKKAGDDVTTHTFAINGTTYEIDLGDANYNKLLKALAPFMENGRRQPKGKGRSSNGSRPRSASKHDTAAVRAWAKKNGYDVNDRGRIPSDVMSAYEAAN